MMIAAPVRAADRALVPLEDGGWTARMVLALESLEVGRFRQGIEILEEALTAAPGRLVRVPGELPRDLAVLRRSLEAAAGATAEEEASQDAGRRFLSVSALASHSLSCLPAPALRMYRQLYDEMAAKSLARHLDTGETAPLRSVVRRFFFTSAGDDAAEILGDELLEAGKYRSAAGWWRRILLAHPDPDVPAEGLRLKILYALRLVGAEAEYAPERALYLERLEGAEGAEGARTALFDLERTVPMRSRQPAPDGPGTEPEPRMESARWGGELTCEAAPALPGNALAVSWQNGLWAAEGIEQPEERIGPRNTRRFSLTVDRYEAEPMVPFVPLVDGDDVYLSGVFKLYRFHGAPGKGSLRTEYVKPSPSHLMNESRPYVEQSDSAHYTTTIWKKGHAPGGPATGHSLDSLPDAVLLTHYISDRIKGKQFMNYAITVEIPIRSLVAFDAQSTKLLWKTGEGKPLHGERLFQDFAESEISNEPKEEVSYTSPAIVKKGLVIAGGWIQRGYVDILLRALSLGDGSLVWETPVCGSQLELTMFGEMAREPFAGAIVERNGVVYYASQLGALVAVQLETGMPLWLMTYDSIDVKPTQDRVPQKRDTTWSANPLFLLGHLLIATPRDSTYLYAVDTGTGPGGESEAGKVLWRYDNRKGKIRDLLGYHHGHLYFTGPQAVGALDIRGFPGVPAAGDGEREAGEREAGEREAGEREAGEREDGETVEGEKGDDARPGREPKLKLFHPVGSNLVLGPGALAAEGVLFADEYGLRRLSFDLEQPYTLAQEREPFKAPGRLQVVPGGLVFLTSRNLLTAYGPPRPPPPAR